MSDTTRNKVRSLIQTLDRRYPRYKLPSFLPPPSSAEASAAQEVSSKNCELIAGAVLGLHGPPQAGFDASRKLMTQFVDWNELRVAGPEAAMQVLRHDPRSEARIRLIQRFLDAYFLRQRNLALDQMIGMKPGERRQFLTDLQVFGRDELAAFMLTCFGQPMYPPDDTLRNAAEQLGLIRAKTTSLQMAKQFEQKLDLEEMLCLYAGLQALIQAHGDGEELKQALKPGGKKAAKRKK